MGYLSDMDVWSDAQAEDYEELSKDVKALTRVIKLYHLEENNNE